ncbi:trafficking protein particle complex subunit 2-like [Octopus sinensis]|uniref:Trafficking protein particle complex subunit 2-like n=1 Tax=Octopus sinensis TaxID=2607531 RepID=A0A6P7TWM4_9MOLL|nr:trafficking protein particle complex subunit 2-like [Octopus sinensis]
MDPSFHTLFIVNRQYALIFECSCSLKLKDKQERLTTQSLAYGSLDLITDMFWQKETNYLGVVDRFCQFVVSAFVAYSGVMFLLVHYDRPDDWSKSFLTDVFELYSRVSLNPFFDFEDYIHSKDFMENMKQLCRKHCGP